MAGESEQLINQLRLTLGKFEVALGTIDEAIVVMEMDGIIQWCNGAFDRLIGKPHILVLGSNIRDLLPLERNGKPLPDEEYPLSVLGAPSHIKNEHEFRMGGRTIDLEVCTTSVRIHGNPPTTVLVIRDISERNQIDRMKNEFISTVSHEMRTPLTSIGGSLRLIAAGMAGDLSERAKTLLNIAVNNCDRLVRLINDILDIQRNESGRMELCIRPAELMPIVAQAVEVNRNFADTYKVSFVVKDVLPGAMVNVDADRLIQVMTNLLSNAAKFSPPGDLVEIGVTKRDSMFRVTVRDHGPGIPDEFRGRIFNKFAQADASNTRSKGGTGLGLSISKVIVERLGGRIGFENASGWGGAFYFEIPEFTKHP